jgi:hypothetical protein
MEKKAFFRLSLAAIALGAGVFAAVSPAGAADTQPIWSANSPVVNQSTEALRDGRHAHAIRFAKDVLRSKTHAANHLIARHNLCLGYIAQGKGGDAKPFCDLVVSTESASDTTTPTLEAAVRANIARAQGNALAENR